MRHLMTALLAVVLSVLCVSSVRADGGFIPAGERHGISAYYRFNERTNEDRLKFRFVCGRKNPETVTIKYQVRFEGFHALKERWEEASSGFGIETRIPAGETMKEIPSPDIPGEAYYHKIRNVKVDILSVDYGRNPRK